MSMYFLLQVAKDGPPVEIRLNDVPVQTLESIGSRTGGGQVNMWIRPGRNRLRIVGLSPADQIPRTGSVSVTLVKRSKEQTPDQGKTVVAFAWKADGVSRMDMAREFTVDDAPPCEVWQKAQARPLDPAAQAAILAVVTQLHQALAKRDVDRAAALLDFKVLDVGRSVYLSPDDARASHRDFLESMMGEAEWKPEPIDPKDVTFDLMADGQLVRVSRGGKPAVEISIGQATFSLPVYVANIGNTWVVVR